MVICLEQDANLHMAQLMPLPLTDSCFSKIQIFFTFLVPADPGSRGQTAVKRVCLRSSVINITTKMTNLLLIVLLAVFMCKAEHK